MSEIEGGRTYNRECHNGEEPKSKRVREKTNEKRKRKWRTSI